jgi:hypothetical protein
MADTPQVMGLDTVLANIDKFAIDTAAKAAEAMNVIAADNESYAKENRPWTDRTGNARASITGSTGMSDSATFLAALAIGVIYGRYLELDNGGKYAIVWPTMNQRRSKMMETLAGVLGA